MKRLYTSRWLQGFAAFTAVGTLSFFYHFLDDRARGITGTAGTRALEEYSGAYAAALLFVGVVWMARRWPLRRQRWHSPLTLYLLALPVFGAVFTTLMLESRELLSPLLGLGPYNYGDLWWRYPMEFANQVMVYAVMLGAIVLRDLYQENRRRELTAAALRSQLAQAQLEQLRLKLQPHFLFNTLNLISAVMYEDVARADAMLTRLSDLLRHTLEASDASGAVALDHELETCRLYTEIMQARFEHGLQITYRVDPDAGRARVPQFLLQPLVENALRHGGGSVLVSASRQGADLTLEVCDSGAASLTSTEGGFGLGLSTTGQRLQQLYGTAHAFSFGPEPEGGFAVRMRFPLTV